MTVHFDQPISNSATAPFLKRKEAGTLICLLGPTASGKTPLAIALTQYFPFEIVSVDSAMVYRGMNIGTAKPSADILRQVPHHLVDILDPVENYSAGLFRKQCLQSINDIICRGKIPLLVGGTMLYFRVLQQGLAPLPAANAAIREELSAKAAQCGWKKMHDTLAALDKVSAQRISERDQKRIVRALEVYELTGKPMSDLQKKSTFPLANYKIYNIALTLDPRDRDRRIKERFTQMLAQGFYAEAEQLYARGDLSLACASIRAVGYRQMWDYFAGRLSVTTLHEKIIIATRQLAKRQMTWLRSSWPQLTYLDGGESNLVEKTCNILRNKIKGIG